MGDDSTYGIGPHHYEVEPTADVEALLASVLDQMKGMPRPEGPWSSSAPWRGHPWTARVNGELVALLETRRIAVVRDLPCRAEDVKSVSFDWYLYKSPREVLGLALEGGPGSEAYEFAAALSDKEAQFLKHAVSEGWTVDEAYRARLGDNPAWT